MSDKIVVADTGPLIALGVLDLLPVLPQLFTGVFVPPAVMSEAIKNLSKPGAQAIKHAIDSDIIVMHEVNLTGVFVQLAELLDQGESEAIALALHLDGIALIDERKGRKAAQKHGVKQTGTAAILIQAKNKKLISAVKPMMDKLAEHGYRMSSSLVQLVLDKSGE
ncbi:MAG: DUF3368 domain-containing protein [Methylococcales bacterium]|jgi:uncharacterized protein|nr:DUF3368 domain-containing protein [Methylococcales bacterium]MBT7445240.1 DUF3368 domain-containing protein [Methylococcales bacterium]